MTAIDAVAPATVSTEASAPAFSLPAQDGHVVDVARLTTASNVALIFYRGHW